MSSMAVMSWWIWSRSNGVMNVLCRSAMHSWVSLSAARSTASMRCACASSSLNSPIIAASSFAPSTMRAAWALNRSKNFPSRGIRRPSMSFPLLCLRAEAFGFQPLHLVLVEAPVLQRLRAAFAALRRRPQHFGRRTRKARRRRRLLDALHADVGAAGAVVRMARGFRPAEPRREAGVRAFERLHPFVARFRLERFFERRFHRRPLSAVVLDEFVRFQIDFLYQF